MNEHIQKLLKRAETLRKKADAQRAAAQVEIDALLSKVAILSIGAENIKSTKLAELQAAANDAAEDDANDFAAQKLEERKKMKARGENIDVPKSVAEMRAILEAQENANPS
jgi:ribonucleotide reductase alpha subunit